MTRDERNKDIVKRMRGGDPLSSFDAMDSWYPIRPPIKKDEKEVEKLYGKKKPAVREVKGDG